MGEFVFGLILDLLMWLIESVFQLLAQTVAWICERGAETIVNRRERSRRQVTPERFPAA